MSSTVAAILQRAVDGRRLTFDEGVDPVPRGRACSSSAAPRTPSAGGSIPSRTAPTTSTATSTTPTSARRSATSAPSTARSATPRPTCSIATVLLEKIGETVALGGDQILMQGGLAPPPQARVVRRAARATSRPTFPRSTSTASARRRSITSPRSPSCRLRTVLERLKDAGLGSLPGGGAEILVDRVRKEITRGKVLTDDWLEVHRVWHELGGRSTATMMFGHVETLEERIEHLERVRQLQDETGGFTAFISWTFQPEHTDMADVPPAGAFEYLKTQAIARLYLDNVPNIQSSWVTQGAKIGQIGLYFGANDMGSLMIEENVVSSAGTVHHLTLEQIKRAIREAGYIPRQRNVFYRVHRPGPRAGAGPGSRVT